MNRSQREFWKLVRQHYNTTPTSMVNRLMGLEAFTDPLSLPAGTTIGGGFVGSTVPVVVNTATLAMTAALHAGKIINLVGTTAIAGVAITPPAATGTGNKYTIFIGQTITSNTTTIDAKAGNASDVFYGFAFQNKAGTGLSVYATASNSNLITMDGSTRGGIIGDLSEMIDMATNQWWLRITQAGTGTVATCFSNH